MRGYDARKCDDLNIVFVTPRSASRIDFKSSAHEANCSGKKLILKATRRSVRCSVLSGLPYRSRRMCRSVILDRTLLFLPLQERGDDPAMPCRQKWPLRSVLASANGERGVSRRYWVRRQCVRSIPALSMLREDSRLGQELHTPDLGTARQEWLFPSPAGMGSR